MVGPIKIWQPWSKIVENVVPSFRLATLKTNKQQFKKNPSSVKPVQGDQMSLSKNRPKCRPIHFFSFLIQNFTVEK
jgi:hypothetical protein